MKVWYLEKSCPVGGAEQDQSPQLIWARSCPRDSCPQCSGPCLQTCDSHGQIEEFLQT